MFSFIEVWKEKRKKMINIPEAAPRDSIQKNLILAGHIKQGEEKKRRG